MIKMEKENNNLEGIIIKFKKSKKEKPSLAPNYIPWSVSKVPTIKIYIKENKTIIQKVHLLCETKKSCDEYLKRLRNVQYLTLFNYDNNYECYKSIRIW